MLLDICLCFGQFQPDVAYKSVAYKKKSVYLRICSYLWWQSFKRKTLLIAQRERLYGTKYSRMEQVKFVKEALKTFERCLPQSSLGPLLNTWTHIFQEVCHIINCNEMIFALHLSRFRFILIIFVNTKKLNFIKRETLAQVFSCEFCKISKNIIYRTPPGDYFFFFHKSQKSKDNFWKFSLKFLFFLISSFPFTFFSKR